MPMDQFGRQIAGPSMGTTKTRWTMPKASKKVGKKLTRKPKKGKK